MLVEGNGFVAAFVAGLWYANTVSVIGSDSLTLVEDVSHLLALAAWYAFGALAAEAFADGIALQVLAYAILVLTVARFVPVMVSLTGTDFTRPERVAIGWLGPRGVTSIVFAVLAYVQLPQTEADFVVNVTAATVLLSVVLHGVSAEPVARWFARHPQLEERVPPPGPGR
ncbi:cation:proton antiporter domain-containing protein [Streptomyces sp. SS]|uniref:cation:proton antiporter domain-containing protein n=1 Tax=Streptomyces sp. SS TaxID=260742 RepID=UPI000366C9CB|nr:cation:proton antiporter [Streptomyces sp. SS]